MVDRAEVEKAVAERVRGRQFRYPEDAEEDAGEIVVSYDAEIASVAETTLTLDVMVYLEQHDEADDETAAILAREDWWSKIAAELEARLGLAIETGRFELFWC